MLQTPYFVGNQPVLCGLGPSWYKTVGLDSKPIVLHKPCPLWGARRVLVVRRGPSREPPDCGKYRRIRPVSRDSGERRGVRVKTFRRATEPFQGVSEYGWKSDWENPWALIQSHSQKHSKSTPWGTFLPVPLNTPVNGGRDRNPKNLLRLFFSLRNDLVWHSSESLS